MHWVEKPLYFCLSCKQNLILQTRYALDGTQVEGRKETDSDNWQLNKSKGQHLTSLTSIGSLPISHQYLKKNPHVLSVFCLHI